MLGLKCAGINPEQIEVGEIIYSINTTVIPSYYIQSYSQSMRILDPKIKCLLKHRHEYLIYLKQFI